MIGTALALVSFASGTYTAINTGIAAGRVSLKEINDRDEIVGTRTIADPNVNPVGLYWRDGQTRVVSSPVGGSLWMESINDKGVATGLIIKDDDAWVPFLWTAESGFKFISNAGEFSPTSINNMGVVAGCLLTSGKTYLATWSEDQGLKPLLELGEPESPITAKINDQGDIICSTMKWNRSVAYYLPAGGSLQTLTTVPDPQADTKLAEVSGLALNNKGWVCGKTSLVAWPERPGSKIQATLWSPDNARFQAGAGSFFIDLNDSNVAIGRTWAFPSWSADAVVWDQAHGVRILSSLVANANIALERGESINNNGHILAFGKITAGNSLWYVLKPN